MDVLKPVLLFLSGLVVAAAFFLFHMDRMLPHFLDLSGEKPIEVAIVPPSMPTANGCPATYAIDNRTDHLILLAWAGSGGPYGSPLPDEPQWNNSFYNADYNTRSHADRRPPSYDSADMTGLGTDTNPESAEPGVRATDDGYPEDSNYGGSLAEYGNGGARQYDEGFGSAGPDDYSYGGGSAYGNRNSSTYGGAPAGNQGAPGPSRDVFASGGTFSGGGNNIPPPPAGQPIPLTPPDNSSPYGAPNPPAYRDPSGAPWGPPAIRIPPKQTQLASSGISDNPDDQPQDCDPSGNTVTVQLSN